ncbi:MAG: hypothetical protein SFU25_06725 [Candidatus Caenarcaniphilales bacterium]|nr:hypothetical protein [Candidatus Caenarcaniphilales bacterium]
MKDLLNKSPYEGYESILGLVKKAQLELCKESSFCNEAKYLHFLKEAKTELESLSQEIGELTDSGGMLTLNLRLLNNYYKHLFTRAIEDKNEEALSELKYHLMELIAAWKD